jgi:aryl-alcohol dehydrogenase-like predicted oxidoreductase
MSSRVTPQSDLITGSATAAGTLRYAAKFRGKSAAGYFRQTASEISLSSLGIGTYLGEPDATTDDAYRRAVVAAVDGGMNVIDTAINYRFQRSERSIRESLKELIAKGYSRDEIVICTKAGFLTPDGDMPPDANEYFSQEFLDRGVFGPEDIAAGCHCMTPRYLADQLQRSRRNLGVDSIDVFYIHNPETQLDEVPRDEFRKRLKDSFSFLESAVTKGQIKSYGLATWNAFREDPKAQGYLSLEDMALLATEVAGQNHHFRFVQLPLNLAMPEALMRPNQIVVGKTMATVQAGRALGITLIASAALLQGQLTRNLPAQMRAAWDIQKDSTLALQFARSAPGVTTALVGMSQIKHVQENLTLVGIEPAGRDEFLKVFQPRA